MAASEARGRLREVHGLRVFKTVEANGAGSANLSWSRASTIVGRKRIQVSVVSMRWSILNMMMSFHAFRTLIVF